MSAAGRGGDRIPDDNYPTPAWATRRILEALWPDMTRRASGARVLEPCAGELAIVRVVEAFDAQASVCALDIRGPMLDGRVGYADATGPITRLVEGVSAEVFDLLITNPPFDVAHEIIQAQRDTARLCVYLLRSSFLEGERAESYRNDMPFEYKLPERPNFIASEKCKGRKASKLTGGVESLPCGWAQKVSIATPKTRECPGCHAQVQRSTSDASAYSWFVWGSARRCVGHTVILPSTPLEERKAAA